MGAYYNEIDPYAAQWLRNLIAAGHIAPGDIDERSIVDVRSAALRGYTQCHFFAGIGVWSYALRLAGFPDDRPVWSGSCPCQPFSVAGKGDEFGDERHLWPAWFRLVGECRPVAIFGEQVSSKDALAWLDHVCFDLESAGYAVGALDSCAAGVGAPHIRQRFFFVADANVPELGRGQFGFHAQGRSRDGLARNGERSIDVMADDDERRSQVESSTRRVHGDGARGHDADGRGELDPQSRRIGAHATRSTGAASADGALADAERDGGRADEPQREAQGRIADRRPGATNGFWRDAIWLPCRDGKARAIKPGIEPLVNGTPARVGRLRAYGNCIVAPQAAEFIRAYLE